MKQIAIISLSLLLATASVFSQTTDPEMKLENLEATCKDLAGGELKLATKNCNKNSNCQWNTKTNGCSVKTGVKDMLNAEIKRKKNGLLNPSLKR